MKASRLNDSDFCSLLGYFTYFQAVGEYTKMRAIDTCSLLDEEVFASIRLQNNPGELRGRLVEIPFIEHIDVFKGIVVTSPFVCVCCYVFFANAAQMQLLRLIYF